VLRLRRYERLSFENRRICCNGGRLTQNFWYKRSSPTNHSSSQKTSLNGLSYISTDLSTIFSQSKRVTNRETDGWTEFSSLDRVCISCSAIKRRICGRKVLVFSERQLTFTFAICYYPSVLSSVTFVRATRAIEIFGSMFLRDLVHWLSVTFR